MSKEAIEKCIAIAGGQSALVAKMKPFLPGALSEKLRQGHVSNWLLRDRKSEVPPSDYIYAMSKAVGGEVSEHCLRPDLYSPSLVSDQDAA